VHSAKRDRQGVIHLDFWRKAMQQWGTCKFSWCWFHLLMFNHYFYINFAPIIDELWNFDGCFICLFYNTLILWIGGQTYKVSYLCLLQAWKLLPESSAIYTPFISCKSHNSIMNLNFVFTSHWEFYCYLIRIQVFNNDLCMASLLLC